VTKARFAALFSALAAGCAGVSMPELDDPGASSNALFRDYLSDGKFDELGHPFSARVVEAEKFCDGVGHALTTRFQATAADGAGVMCTGVVPGSQQLGELVLNLRVAAAHYSKGALLTARVLDDGTELASATLYGSTVRKAWAWVNLPLRFSNDSGRPLTVEVSATGAATVALDYLELFPADFALVLAPGSGEFGAADWLSFEAKLGGPTISLTANGQPIDLAKLVSSGAASVKTSGFRRVVRVQTGRLLPSHSGDVELEARAGGAAARMQVRAQAPACAWEGAGLLKVLATGFQPFPADAAHDNISRVALAAVRPEKLAGVQLMRVTLPVEFDRAAAEVVSVIERCQPDVVVSFGQGTDEIHLEETAYNLQDTSDAPGGVPDNRGFVALARPIAVQGEAQRAGRLPLDAVAAALSAYGEPARLSDDPGRYVCNNVFYAELGATDRPAGFIHLPYTAQFTDEARAHWGEVVETILNALAN
jgi:pyroglutamyl-peptidase